MQQQEMTHRIRNHPKFQELVTKRNSFAWKLAIAMLAIYYGFILLVAFAKGFLSTPLAEGMLTTWGLPVGVGVILSAFVLTGIYVRRANSEFDGLTRQLLEETK